MNKLKIAQYYDYTLPFYRLFWYGNSPSYALHYGFWEKGTKNLNEALLNENKFLAEKVSIKAGDKILDAGCGTGGSTIWLAKNFDVVVTGITISKNQIEEAKKLAQRNNIADKTKFLLKDYLNTGFPNNSFDVVWAIESVCHTEYKGKFLKEAYRILKHGGRLIVADGFMARNPLDEREKQILSRFTEGFALPNLSNVTDFKNQMLKNDFKNIKYWDKNKEISPSSKRIYLLCFPGYLITKILRPLKIFSKIMDKHCLTGIVQREAFKTRFFVYGVYYGAKL